VNKQIALLIGDVVRRYPQAWSRVLPVVFFVLLNSEIVKSGLTARDVDRSWSLRDHTERELTGLDVGPALPVDQWVARTFENYKTVRDIVGRRLAERAELRADAVNRGRHAPEWQIGMRVFRRSSNPRPRSICLEMQDPML